MAFRPEEWMKSQVLEAGVYTVSVTRFDERLGPDGTPMFVVRFMVAEKPDHELTDFWKAGVPAVMRRAISLAKLVDSSLVFKDYPNEHEFLRVVLQKATSHWFKARIAVEQHRDGELTSRIKQFLEEVPESEVKIGDLETDVRF